KQRGEIKVARAHDAPQVGEPHEEDCAKGEPDGPAVDHPAAKALPSEEGVGAAGHPRHDLRAGPRLRYSSRPVVDPTPRDRDRRVQTSRGPCGPRRLVLYLFRNRYWLTIAIQSTMVPVGAVPFAEPVLFLNVITNELTPLLPTDMYPQPLVSLRLGAPSMVTT